MFRYLIAPIISAVLLSQPSNLMFNMNNVYEKPTKENVKNLFDFTLLRQIIEDLSAVKKQIAQRNNNLNRILDEIDI